MTGATVCPSPVPLGAALMLLAKCPLVAGAFTLKISSSKQPVTTASSDGIGFCFFVWFPLNRGHDLLGQPRGVAERWNSWTATRWWPERERLPRMLLLICGKLGFGWPSHIIPVRVELVSLPLVLNCIHHAVFIILLPSLYFCHGAVWGSVSNPHC